MVCSLALFSHPSLPHFFFYIYITEGPFVTFLHHSFLLLLTGLLRKGAKGRFCGVYGASCQADGSFA